MLKLAEGLSLPIDTVTQSMAILARRGAGKTYTGNVLAEEVIKAGVPVVILDPTGAWWGLRSSADGKKAGLPVTIFGGDHGDMLLEPTAGALFAEVVLEHPGAYVFDFSAFASKAAEQAFAASFLEHLYRGKKGESGPLLVIVDEADMFAPQQPRDKGDQLRTLGALESIVRRGRIKGLGVLLITQRAAVLNKNVLTQTEILIIMQTTGPQDRDAIEEWIKGNGTPAERAVVLDSMASMEQGEAWVWSPAFLRILQRVRIRRRSTFDSSKTPGAGEARIEPTTFAKVDLDKLGKRVAATIEKQAENDPYKLKAEINRLKRELAQKPSESKTVEVEKIVEVPVLTPIHEAMVAQLKDVMQSATKEITDALALAAGSPLKMRITPSERPPMPPPKVKQPALRVVDQPTTNGELKLGAAERAFLAALAQYQSGLTKTRLSLITGYSGKSGHFANVLGKLRAAEYITRGEPIQITPMGRIVLGPYDLLPAPGDELVAYWKNRLGKAERTMLEVFVSYYPQPVLKEQLGEASGYSHTSGHFANVLGRLRGLGLIDGWKASDELMG